MDINLAKRLKLSSVRIDSPMPATALDGHDASGYHRTSPVTLIFPDSHTEQITFHLFDPPQHPLILGYPWLTLHNPHIDWSSGKVLSWGSNCKTQYFLGPPVSSSEGVSTLPKEVDEEFPDLSSVPPCYQDHKQLFNKTKATSLPPHRPYDCSIDLLPGTSPPCDVEDGF